MVKVVFFDIDGTLLSFKTHTMSEGTLRSLSALREKGIKLIIATGRHVKEAQVVNSFFDFDGFITLNGQYCFNKEGVIHKHAIDKSDLEIVIEEAKKNEFSFCFCHEDGMFANMYSEVLNAVANRIDVLRPPISDPTEALNMEIYQIIAYFEKRDEHIILDKTKTLFSTRWTDDFTDFTPIGGGKDKGLQAVLDYYGFDVTESMAFGDGENDIPMLKYAGKGIAMGQGFETVKNAADYVTASVDDDGIEKALLHFGIL